MGESYRIPFFEEEEQPKGMPKGFGLQSIGILKSLGNPETTIPKTDIAGLLIGGLIGWWVAKKFPNMIIKYVGIIAGAELGILIARMFKTGNNIERR